VPRVLDSLYDGDDQPSVADEFDAEFRCRLETRGHVAEWVGEAALQEGFAAWTWT
jgi:hypothetical protein